MIPQAWYTPPKEFSLAPFWFWNDELNETELIRQLDEFQSHGVDAFVLHPRVGLPRDMGWMSHKLLDKMRFVIEEAERRGMWLVLYDEGMYPSGSSSGQVVAENPAYQCRGLLRINLDDVQPNSDEQGIYFDEGKKPILSEYQSLIAEVTYKGQACAIIQRPVKAVIRGLHYLNEESDEPPEDSPLATDLLNPDAVACFIRLVYQRYFEEFGGYFSKTIQAIFTDEPNLLGRLQEENIIAGTSDILNYVNDYLGYDFTPYLPALWDETAPPWIADDYERALEHRLEATYYSQLYQWCEAHQIALTGHPAEPDALRQLRYFHIAGQDIVWRQIEADKPSALEGRQSTQAKAASSVMLHQNRRRNANEFCGAYGHDLSFEEMKWLAHWLLIRGCNLLIPHAFYYSIRGPRFYERPPDVGLHSVWWDNGFREFASASRRLAWLNTDSELICHVVILGEHHHLPWRAAKACFQHQIDFNYLDIDDLEACQLVDKTIQIGRGRYHILIVDGMNPKLESLEKEIELIVWTDDTEACIKQLKKLLPASPFDRVEARGLRVRNLRKEGLDWYMLFNEDASSIECEIALGNSVILNPYTQETQDFDGRLILQAYEIRILVCEGD